MNATLIMAFILILIVVATVITKKLPFNRGAIRKHEKTQ